MVLRVTEDSRHLPCRLSPQSSGGSQAPSNYPEFARFPATIDIDSISLNPDSLAAVARRLAS